LFVLRSLQSEKIIINLIKDIRRRKEIENIITEGERKYESIFNNTHNPMLIIEAENGHIRDANRAASRYYGYTKKEILKLKISDINVLSEKQIFEEMELARSKDRKHFKFKYRLSSGKEKDVEVYSGPITINNEKLLFSIIHDVQEKKEMELKYEIQETYFRNLFENSLEAIALLDNEFRTVNINRSFEKFFLYSINEIKN